MRTFIGVILPLLVILLMTPVASAQDVPALVLIDVNVHFTTPQASVTFSGQQEWRNGFGYADSATRGFTNRWTVTGSECGPNCAWLEPYYQNVAPGAPPRTDFRLDVEAGSVNGQFHFFIGFPGLWGDVVLPGDYAASGTYIDQVKFPMIGGIFASDGGHITVVASPEPKVLRRLMPKHIYGKQLNALLNPPLQRLTASGAATLLRGKLDGMMIDLPSVRLDVQEWCSGLVTMKWLTLLAIVIALIPRGDWRWKVALVLVALLIAPASTRRW